LFPEPTNSTALAPLIVPESTMVPDRPSLMPKPPPLALPRIVPELMTVPGGLM
jgi:hypothetical protein